MSDDVRMVNYLTAWSFKRSMDALELQAPPSILDSMVTAMGGVVMARRHTKMNPAFT